MRTSRKGCARRKAERTAMSIHSINHALEFLEPVTGQKGVA